MPGVLALIKEPTLCFTDKRTAALDWATTSVYSSSYAVRPTTSGATVLVVAHDARARPFADREFIQDDDRLRERGGDG